MALIFLSIKLPSLIERIFITVVANFSSVTCYQHYYYRELVKMRQTFNFSYQGRLPSYTFPDMLAATVVRCVSFSLLNAAYWNCENNTTLHKCIKIHVIMPLKIPQKPYDL